MLVFTRKRGESLMIGDDVEIKVVSVGPDHVRLGISAPRRIPVHRREIYDAIIEQNKRASRSQVPTAEVLSRVTDRFQSE